MSTAPESRHDIISPVIYTTDFNESYTFEVLFELAHCIRMCGDIDTWADIDFWMRTQFETVPLSESMKLKLSIAHKSNASHVALVPSKNTICAAILMFREGETWFRAGGLRWFRAVLRKPRSQSLKCSMLVQVNGNPYEIQVRSMYTDRTFISSGRTYRVKAWPQSGQNVLNRSLEKLREVGLRMQLIWPCADLTSMLPAMLTSLRDVHIKLIISYLPPAGSFAVQNPKKGTKLDGSECWVCQEVATRGVAKPCKYNCPMILCETCISSDYTSHECPESRRALALIESRDGNAKNSECKQ